MFQNIQESHIATIERNTNVLSMYPVGANVVISDAESPRKKRYGVLVGYQLNCFGELCVKVDLATMDGRQDLHVLNPFNMSFMIKVVS